MNQPKTASLESIIDSGPVTSYQVIIMAICAIVAMMDGFDTQAIAFVAPEIAAAWHVDPSLFGPVFGAGLLGGLIGGIVIGTAGDRFGRRPALLVSVLIFALGSLATSRAESVGALTALRFATGIGLGGALPCFISLTSEYAPKRLRSTLVGAMFCGFPLGALIGGMVSAKLIPTYGWTSVFLVGGAFPLLVIPLVATVVPESVRFLALRKDAAAIERVLRHMKSPTLWDGRPPAGKTTEHAPVSQLFTGGRAPGTFLLWVTLFCSLLLTYFLINWIPVIARRAGLEIGTAVHAVAMLNLGALVGCIALGRLADRFNRTVVIAIGYALGAVVIALAGHTGSSGTLLCLATFAAGFLSVGAQMCSVALCADYYDTALRATGVGWSIGIGRLGAIVGPVVGGILLSKGTEPSTLFVVAGATSLAAAFAVLALGRHVPRRGGRAERERPAQFPV
jgi:AAHS family 4-hydroxybenzoate transporter-like MFS transporter